MTPDLDAVRAMVEGVTLGPWQTNGSHIYGPDPGRDLVCQAHGMDGRTFMANLAFIAASRELVPALAAEVEANRVTIAALEARVEALTGALQTADDALTEAEAILGGEYGDHYGPLCETMLEIRKQIAALSQKDAPDA